jgi:AAA+ superfamily predicted ATPase
MSDKLTEPAAGGMHELHDLAVLVRSRTPIVVIESSEEERILQLLNEVAARLPGRPPVFVWSITEGLRRQEPGYGAQRHNAKPLDVLSHVKSCGVAGIFLLLDFHPYLQDPVHVRLLKEIAQRAEGLGQTLVFLSHELVLPPELRPLSARFELALPDAATLERLVREEAEAWSRANAGRRVRADAAAVALLVRNLGGLTASDARRLARQAIHDDGAITAHELQSVMKAKYELMGRDSVLSFEFETARFSDVGGLQSLQSWLSQRKAAFHREPAARGLDVPRGILLLGVQGCGKSLAAKAVAGTWGVPLLRLDFGALYDKFIGETERKLRACLQTSEVMAPCVLWMDEIEKGVATGEQDGGTSVRVLGTLLTWMAENDRSVFVVATANDIAALPPELVRKGRLDEIFFVDLPSPEVRAHIFAIHLRKRGLDPARLDTRGLAAATDGFSGAEIEQAVVSALYTAHAHGTPLGTEHVLHEVRHTRPLSVVLGERVQALRSWAAGRAVSAD